MKPDDRIRDLLTVIQLLRSGEARRIRESAGLSQGELAAWVGVDKVTLWRWENGEKRPRANSALRYLTVLNEIKGVVGAAS